MKLVAGYNGGITGSFALTHIAVEAYNDLYSKYDSSLRLVTYPVSIVDSKEGEPAFDVTYAYDPDEESYDSALQKCKDKAQLLVDLFNK